jgi:hypothetical protein
VFKVSLKKTATTHNPGVICTQYGRTLPHVCGPGEVTVDPGLNGLLEQRNKLRNRLSENKNKSV